VARKEYRKRHDAALTIQEHTSRFLARKQVRRAACSTARASYVHGLSLALASADTCKSSQSHAQPSAAGVPDMKPFAD
jgi:hypothetical protein